MVLIEVAVRTEERVADAGQNSADFGFVETVTFADQRKEIFGNFFVDENDFAVSRKFANETEKNKRPIKKFKNTMA